MTEPTQIEDRRLTEAGIDPNNEEQLIRVVDDAKNPFLAWVAALRLRHVGTLAALPALKRALHLKKTDVKIAAGGAIANILTGDGCELYIQLLRDAKYPEKWVAVLALSDYCGGEGVPAVVQRVRKILARGRAHIGWIQGETELTPALAYLHKWAPEDVAVIKVYDKALSVWEELDSREHATLIRTVTYLRERAPTTDRIHRLQRQPR